MNYSEFKNVSIAHLDELYAFAVRLSRSRTEADDLVQDTYARAFSRWRQLRRPEAVRPWLFQILRGIFINKRRRTARSPFLQLVGSADERAAEAGIAPEEAGRYNASSRAVKVNPPLVRDIEAALESLSHDAREVVLLADLWGFDYQEIAEIVGCPVGTVRSRLHRARARLATALDEYAVEPAKAPDRRPSSRSLP